MTSRKHSVIAPSVQQETPETRTAGPQAGHYSYMPASVFQDPALVLSDVRVLGAIAAFMNPARGAWPKQQTIADYLGISRRAVNGSIAVLRERGYLEVNARFKKQGGRRENHYLIRLVSPPTDQDLVDPPEDDTPPAPSAENHSSQRVENQQFAPPTHSEFSATKDEQSNRNKPPNPLRGDDNYSKEILQRADELAARLIEGWPGRRHTPGRRMVARAIYDAVSAHEGLTVEDLVWAIEIGGKSLDARYAPSLTKWLRDGKFEAWLPKAATSKPGQGASAEGVGLPCPVSEQGEKMLAELVAAYGSTKIAAWFSAVSWETDLIRAANAYDAQRIGVEFGGFLRKFGFTVVEGSAAA